MLAASEASAMAGKATASSSIGDWQPHRRLRALPNLLLFLAFSQFLAFPFQGIRAELKGTN